MKYIKLYFMICTPIVGVIIAGLLYLILEQLVVLIKAIQ